MIRRKIATSSREKSISPAGKSVGMLRREALRSCKGVPGFEFHPLDRRATRSSPSAAASTTR
jgi:hypothetical protein